MGSVHRAPRRRDGAVHRRPCPSGDSVPSIRGERADWWWTPAFTPSGGAARKRSTTWLPNSPQAQNNIENEVDRYIGWPGQALAYKIGQREIFRLRAMAQERLGDRFDIKGFHDAVLGSGLVPLPILGELIEEWIDATAST